MCNASASLPVNLIALFDRNNVVHILVMSIKIKYLVSDSVLNKS